MNEFTDQDWEMLQGEINAAIDAPKIEQLDNITILQILEMVPEGEIWLICLGRFRVKWQNKENFRSWWSPKNIWWMGKVAE